MAWKETQLLIHCFLLFFHLFGVLQRDTPGHMYTQEKTIHKPPPEEQPLSGANQPQWAKMDFKLSELSKAGRANGTTGLELGMATKKGGFSACRTMLRLITFLFCQCLPSKDASPGTFRGTSARTTMWRPEMSWSGSRIKKKTNGRASPFFRTSYPFQHYEGHAIASSHLLLFMQCR